MTIKEVAKIAGVSPAAVSRYMNGGSLSEKKRAAIRQAIDQTGYRPSPAARVMRTGQLNQVGIIIPRIYSDSVSQIVEGVNKVIREEGYMLVVCSTDGIDEQELSYLELMENNRAAGVIIMGTSQTPQLIDAYHACRMPLIITGQNVPGMPCVYHDDIHALSDLTTMMLEKGRQNIAYIGVLETDPQAGTARRMGVEGALAQSGRKKEDLIRMEVHFDPEEGFAAAKKILREHANVDGIICATDTIATGAMRAVHDAGRTIGGDISLAGVGDNWMNNYMPVPLTTAHYLYDQCGEDAAEMLLEEIAYSREEKAFPVRQICLSYTIIDRGSI